MGNLVICYNCYADNKYNLQVFAGCLLCETVGNKKGLIKKKYATIPININGSIFTPPECKCSTCMDSKFVNYVCRDANPYNYPHASIIGIKQLPCHVCNPTDHKLEYDQIYQVCNKKLQIKLALDFMEPELQKTLAQCKI